MNITTSDTSICNGSSVTLRAVNAGAVPVNTALATDDVYSGAIPIGFSFTFYGNTYTQCWVSSNGYITFDTRTQGSRSEYNPNTSGVIPGNTDVRNSIMGIWNDIDPSVSGSGTIDYATYGTAPNRKFVVTYCDIPMWTSTCQIYKESFQIVLFETTNVIEVHIGDKPICTANWGGAAIEGLQNAAGTIAHLVSGRGYPTVPWAASRDSRRFTPTSASNYVIDSIPYSKVSTSGGGTITWFDVNRNIMGTGTSITVLPTVSPSTYYARQIYCADTTTDSVKVYLSSAVVDSIQVHHPSYCGNNDGSLVLFGLQPNKNYEVNYSKNGVPQPQSLIGTTSQGTLTINNLTSGIYASIRVNFPGCLPGAARGPYTLVDPRIPVNFTSSVRYVCYNNDVVTFNNTTSIPGAVGYEWRFGDGNITPGSSTPGTVHTYVNQGNYPVTLVADNGVCRDSVTQYVDTRHPLDAFFLVDHELACQFQTLNFKDSSLITYGNGPQPQFSWDFGDGNSATGATTTHAYQNVGTYVVRLIVTDFVPCTDTFYRTITVGVPPVVSFASNVNTFCEGQGAVFTANFSSETPTGYEWMFGDGTVIGNTNPVQHAYDSSGTYTIKLVAHYRYCPDTNYASQVTVQPFPGINLGPDTSLCPDASPVTLRNLVDYGNYAGATYAWTTGASTPAITVNSEGTYGATINYNGCSSSDSITILKDCYLDIPNSFTPNNDGLNDYFLPRQFLSRSVTSYKMSVFNRWGEVVFESTALDGRGWDGKFNNAVQPAGVYIYIIDVAFANGTREHYTGNVTMIR